MLLVGCGPDSFLDRRDMQIDDGGGEQAANVRLDVDWLSAFDTKPTGMTAMAFSDIGQRLSNASNNVDSMDISVSPGIWRLLMFNMTPGEFGSMAFSEINNFDSIRVSLRPMMEDDAREWAPNARFMREPEEFAITTDSMTITDNLQADDCDSIIDEGSKRIYVYRENPHPIATTLSIRVEVRGIENARSVEGSIDGMAGGYLLTQGHASTTQGTFLLDEWKGAVDNTEDSIGHITTSITTFGLPFHKGEDITKRDSTANWLTLFFKLRDGKTTCTYRYPVGNEFHYIKVEHGNRVVTTEQTLSLDIDISGNKAPHLPNVINNGSASGFSADVDPWKDGGTSEITF